MRIHGTLQMEKLTVGPKCALEVGATARAPAATVAPRHFRLKELTIHNTGKVRAADSRAADTNTVDHL